MKALVKAKREEGLWLEEVPIPLPGSNEVVIKILRTAICGTDVHIFNWDAWAQQTIPVPMPIGHEFVGVIDQVGDNVHDFKQGDLVSGEGHLVCGHCRNCLAGRRHLCMNTSGVGVNRQGAFAEYLAIPVTNVWLLRPRHSPRHPGLLRSPRQCRAHRPLLRYPRRRRPHHRRRTDRLHGRGHRQTRRGAACGGHRCQSLPAEPGPEGRCHPDRRCRAGRHLPDVQKELGMKEGFDVAMEMSGNPAALHAILANMCHGGKIAMLGIMPGATAIDWNKVIFNGLTLKGIYGREMYETWYKMTSMIQTGLDITPLITHRFHYTDYAEAFAVMRSGQSGKVILNWAERE